MATMLKFFGAAGILGVAIRLVVTMLSGVEVHPLNLAVTIAVFLAASAAWVIGEVLEKCSHE